MNKKIEIIFCMCAIILAGCGKDDKTEPTKEDNGTAFSIEVTNESSDKDTTMDDISTAESSSSIEESSQTQQPTTVAEVIGASDFSGAAFIGDSRTQGLDVYGATIGADFYAAKGATVNEMLSKPVIELKNGEKKMLIEAMAGHNYEQIYIMLGINEVGWPSTETFGKYYIEIVNQVKTKYPNAKIYIQGIFPMVEARTDAVYNNSKIALFNEEVKRVAATTQTEYIDISPALVDATGTLPTEASNDGIHLNKVYCAKWAKYLYEKTRKAN